MTRATDALDVQWLAALVEFDAGHRKPLADLLKINMPMTDMARAELVEIVMGARKPAARGASRRKLSPASRELSLFWLAHLRAMRVAALADAERIERTAEERGCEVADVCKWINAQYRDAVAQLAAECGVSVDTLESVAKPSG